MMILGVMNEDDYDVVSLEYKEAYQLHRLFKQWLLIGSYASTEN